MSRTEANLQPHHEPDSVLSTDICSVCGADLPVGEYHTVEDLPACANCANRIAATIHAEEPAAAVWPAAVVGGAFGAVIGGALWAAIAVITDYEVGFLAVAVGFLTGLGVKLGARSAASRPLQFAAAGLAIVGLLAAKYFMVAHYMCQAVNAKGGSLSYFSGEIWAAFPGLLFEIVRPYDALWLFLMVRAAYKVPEPSETRRVE